MRESSHLDIDTAALHWNLKRMSTLVGPDCAICGVVKANGYGLGATSIGPRLVAAGCEMLAVYTPEDALALVDAGGSVPLLIFMPLWGETRIRQLLDHPARDRFHFVIHCRAQLEDFAKTVSGQSRPTAVHVKMDTGLSRGGCDDAEALEMLRRIRSSPGLRLAGVCTHFASADTDEAATQAQMEEFDRWLDRAADLLEPSCVVHVANTFGMLRHRRYHRTMVRVGLGWTGHGPELMSGLSGSPESVALRPIMRWVSQTVLIKTIERGSEVGYGGSWKAQRRTVLGVVPVGYADGYPLAAGRRDGDAEGGMVGVLTTGAGQASTGYAKVVGAISMDQMTIDLTDLVASGDPPESLLGATVELIGTDPERPNSLAELARRSGMIPHQVLCAISPLLRRVFRGPVPLVQTIEAKPGVPASAVTHS